MASPPARWRVDGTKNVSLIMYYSKHASQQKGHHWATTTITCHTTNFRYYHQVPPKYHTQPPKLSQMAPTVWRSLNQHMWRARQQPRMTHKHIQPQHTRTDRTECQGPPTCTVTHGVAATDRISRCCLTPGRSRYWEGEGPEQKGPGRLRAWRHFPCMCWIRSSACPQDCCRAGLA